MNNELVNTKDVIATANRFTALVTDSNTTSNAVGKKPSAKMSHVLQTVAGKER